MHDLYDIAVSTYYVIICSEVLVYATRRPLIGSEASSVLIWNSPVCWRWWLVSCFNRRDALPFTQRAA